MLKFILKDTNGKITELKKPLKVSFVSSEEAPADRLTAVFAVDGNIPVIESVEMLDGIERLFYGLVDEQVTEETAEGMLLTVYARSLACILLDNEAMPQTYCIPSMPLLMKRHFSPLGFDHFIGSDEAFNGEMTVSKGMSEWTVLKSFCDAFIGTVPRIHTDGTIDITGNINETVYLQPERIISIKRSLKNKNLISQMIARTYTGGGYEMQIENNSAKKLGIKRRRYINSIDSKSRTVLTAKRLMKKSFSEYEQITADCCGRILCSIGAQLIIGRDKKHYIVKEINYSFDSSGEHTKIYARLKREDE